MPVHLDAEAHGLGLVGEPVDLHWLDPDDVAAAVVGEGLALHLVLKLRQAGRLLGVLRDLLLHPHLVVRLPLRLPLLHFADAHLLLVLFLLALERDRLVRGALPPLASGTLVVPVGGGCAHRRGGHGAGHRAGGHRAGGRHHPRPGGGPAAGDSQVVGVLPTARLGLVGLLPRDDPLPDRDHRPRPRVDADARRLRLQRPPVELRAHTVGVRAVQLGRRSAARLQAVFARVARHVAHPELGDQLLGGGLDRERVRAPLHVGVVQHLPTPRDDRVDGILGRRLRGRERVEKPRRGHHGGAGLRHAADAREAPASARVERRAPPGGPAGPSAEPEWP
mmetsp:Transcript_35528/g.95474  ORF Transcript_35528/g.95474 Transcript_35528/m.95474 type:complete len:335 (+) Transcript_35528:1005-2009(+)